MSHTLATVRASFSESLHRLTRSLILDVDEACEVPEPQTQSKFFANWYELSNGATIHAPNPGDLHMRMIRKADFLRIYFGQVITRGARYAAKKTKFMPFQSHKGIKKATFAVWFLGPPERPFPLDGPRKFPHVLDLGVMLYADKLEHIDFGAARHAMDYDHVFIRRLDGNFDASETKLINKMIKDELLAGDWKFRYGRQELDADGGAYRLDFHWTQK